MNELNIESALNYRLAEYIVAYPIAVDYGNIGYSPVEGTNYLKIDFLPAITGQAEIGTASQNRTVGIYQITTNTKSGNGKYDTITIVNQLKEYFKRGTLITNPADGTDVRIQRFYLGPYLEDPVWFQQVVRIEFRSDLDN